MANVAEAGDSHLELEKPVELEGLRTRLALLVKTSPLALEAATVAITPFSYECSSCSKVHLHPRKTKHSTAG